MKVLELIHSLEEAYDRFGDIDVKIELRLEKVKEGIYLSDIFDIKEMSIEADQVLITCEE